MRVALIHDSLGEFGGAERVLQQLLGLFPDADVYTLFYDRETLFRHFPLLNRSHIHAVLGEGRLLRHRNSLLQIFANFVWRRISFSGYDLVISNSGYMMSAMISPHPLHIAYIQTPPKNLIGLTERTPLQRIFGYTTRLAGRYRQSVQTLPHVLVNSFHMKRVFETILGFSPDVLYPGVELKGLVSRPKEREHFLIISRLDNLKHIELAIQACTRLSLPLKIIGTAVDQSYKRHLRNIAGPTVEFLDFVPDNEIAPYYRRAKAFLFTAKEEDFGIAPLEALGYGIPVISYFGGGVKETLKAGVTGEFFYSHDVESLMSVLRYFDTKKYTSQKLHAYVNRFSTLHFRKTMMKYIASAKREQERL